MLVIESNILICCKDTFLVNKHCSRQVTVVITQKDAHIQADLIIAFALIRLVTFFYNAILQVLLLLIIFCCKFFSIFVVC